MKRETLERMVTNQLSDQQFPVRFESGPWPGMGFGLGLGVQVDNVPKVGWPAGVFGWIGVSGAIAWVYPEEELIVLVMPQSFFYWDASDNIRKLAYRTLV